MINLLSERTDGKMVSNQKAGVMTMTREQMRDEFIRLVEANGFTPNGETLKLYEKDHVTLRGVRTVYSRVWSREVFIYWHGKIETTLEIKVDALEGLPQVLIYRNGFPDECRTYSTPGRAIAAMRGIVENAGFEF
jgi:hypothetical protein